MHLYMYNGGMLNKSKELNNMNTNKLDKTEAELVILKLEYKKLSIDIAIVSEQYARNLINEERYGKHIDCILKEQTYLRRRMNSKIHQIKNPDMYFCNEDSDKVCA